MIKSVIVYKNVENSDTFKQYYLNEILPRVKNITGIIGINITNILQQIQEDVIPSIRGIQFIIELYFESEQTMKEIAHTPECQELMSIMKEKAPGEVTSLLGQQNTYSNNRQKFLYAPRWDNEYKPDDTSIL
jgi:hypothetical protein